MKRQWLIPLALFLLLALIAGCSTTGAPAAPDSGLTTVAPNNPPPSGNTGTIGKRTKTSGCAAHNALPDSACTPGAIIATATTDQICQPGYSKNVRNVTTSVKNQVYAEYGITERATGEYEVDHLISLELGGSNAIANLWPEPAEPRPGFHEKDKVENYMHAQVCNGAISLGDAQAQIATNWLALYQRMPASAK
ncbi:MAG: HNH endonuclease [Anaerolineae bacterium]